MPTIYVLMYGKKQARRLRSMTVWVFLKGGGMDASIRLTLVSDLRAQLLLELDALHEGRGFNSGPRGTGSLTR